MKKCIGSTYCENSLFNVRNSPSRSFTTTTAAGEEIGLLADALGQSLNSVNAATGHCLVIDALRTRSTQEQLTRAHHVMSGGIGACCRGNA